MADKELEQAIADIDSLFPTDSQYEPTNKIGERLLAQAKREVEGWRAESRAVLIRYAQLCRDEENRIARESDRHYFANRAGHYVR